jgi:hypothetical protein
MHCTPAVQGRCCCSHTVDSGTTGSSSSSEQEHWQQLLRWCACAPAGPVVQQQRMLQWGSSMPLPPTPGVYSVCIMSACVMTTCVLYAD